VVMQELQSALVHLVSVQLAQRSLLEVCRDVARLAAVTLPDVDEVSVNVVESVQAATTSFSGVLAAALDERQYADGFGPALTAARSGTVVRIDDTAAEAHFAGFAAIARRHGVTSVLALDLPVPGGTIGSLCLYRRGSVGPVSSTAHAVAAAFAGHAAPVLVGASLLARREREISQLEAAAPTRAVIDQAKGIVMCWRACDEDEAFQRLAKHSQRTNRKLRDIAADLTAAAARGEEPPGTL
jgi:GAF domain-containing protein